MASYKICFFDFCYRNRSSSDVEMASGLQNATREAGFIKKKDL